MPLVKGVLCGTDCDSARSITFRAEMNPEKIFRIFEERVGRKFEALVDEALVVSGRGWRSWIWACVLDWFVKGVSKCVRPRQR